jgi:hypothetical protein
LKNLARLNVLNLNECTIVDADLPRLEPLGNLRIVRLKDCAISDEVIRLCKVKQPLLAFFRW